MDSTAEVKETHMRHECMGVSYYSAWLATSRRAPVCLGFSQVKQESATDMHLDTAVEVQQQQPGQDFKQLCIGYSSYSTASTALPYCEGVELLMETTAEAKHDTSNSTYSTQSQQHQVASQQQQQHHKPEPCSTTTMGTALKSSQPTQPMHTAQQQGGTQQDEQPVPATRYKLLLSKAAVNWAALQKGFNNEGPLKLKPWPQDWQEAQNRLVSEASRNGTYVAQGCMVLAALAYQVTVKPVTDTLGITPRHKS